MSCTTVTNKKGINHKEESTETEHLAELDRNNTLIVVLNTFLQPEPAEPSPPQMDESNEEYKKLLEQDSLNYASYLNSENFIYEYSDTLIQFKFDELERFDTIQFDIERSVVDSVPVDINKIKDKIEYSLTNVSTKRDKYHLGKAFVSPILYDEERTKAYLFLANSSSWLIYLEKEENGWQIKQSQLLSIGCVY